MTVLALMGIAYALGCFSTGYYWARWRTGTDIRAIGTHTTGAFNVARALGGPSFWIVVAGDALKGVLAVAIAQAVSTEPWVWFGAMVAVVLGHNFPVQLGFRGGNGLATSSGALLLLDPQLALALTILLGVSLPILGVLKTVLKWPIRYYTPSKITVLATPFMAFALGRELWLALGLAGLVAVIMWTLWGKRLKELYASRR